jgi:hypothetical protein
MTDTTIRTATHTLIAGRALRHLTGHEPAHTIIDDIADGVTCTTHTLVTVIALVTQAVGPHTNLHVTSTPVDGTDTHIVRLDYEPGLGDIVTEARCATLLAHVNAHLDQPHP